MTFEVTIDLVALFAAFVGVALRRSRVVGRWMIDVNHGGVLFLSQGSLFYNLPGPA